MQTIALNPIPGLSFLSEENGVPCHKHMLNGREIPGCTSVSGLFQDDGWKFAWPPKLMYETAMRMFSENRNIDGFRLDIIDGILQKAKGAWRVKRDKSADTGVQAHSLIEHYIKTRELPPVHPNKEVFNCFNEFYKWELKTQPEWLGSEIQVGSAINGFAGILDAICKIDGKTVLLDFKTSADIKDDYAIQLAGLCIALEEMGLRVDLRAILHLPKTGEYEYRVIDSDLEKDKAAFLAGLNFYSHKNLFMSRVGGNKKNGWKKDVGRAIAGDRKQGRGDIGGAAKLEHSPGGAVSPKEGANGNIGNGAPGEV